jgi:hypothetical protein
MTKSSLLRVFGGIAIVLLFFFSTLLILDFALPSWRNRTRAEDARTIRTALAAYYKAHRAYPGPADIPADNLARFLVDERFASEIPRDPVTGAAGYHYVSDGKTYYGLIVKLEPSSALWGSTEGGPCLVGVGTETTRVFGDPPPRGCSF